MLANDPARGRASEPTSRFAALAPLTSKLVENGTPPEAHSRQVASAMGFDIDRAWRDSAHPFSSLRFALELAVIAQS